MLLTKVFSRSRSYSMPVNLVLIPISFDPFIISDVLYYSQTFNKLRHLQQKSAPLGKVLLT